MDVGWAENDNFDGQSTIERSQWEYEHICRSLKDGNCDDVIRFLLAEPRGRNKSSQKNRNASPIPQPPPPPPSTNETNVETVSTSSSSSSSTASSTSLALKSTENSLRRSESNCSSTSIWADASNSPTGGSTLDSQERQEGQMHRKPPMLPSRCSAVINLDKNRINAKRHRHRTKLLPRPISLPSSFNLWRNFRPPNDPGTETIDIELIKQLEDEIYRSRDEVRRPNKIHNANGTCKNCQRRVDTAATQFRPNQVTETKIFADDLKRFNDQQKAILLLDSWQLQPLLMRRDKMEFCDFYDRQTIRLKEKVSKVNDDAPRSLLIVDNSRFYPVLMKYEFHKNGALIAADSHANADDASACDCIENGEQTQDFARLFQIHLSNRLAADSVEKDASHHVASVPNGNETTAASPSVAQKCFPFRSVSADSRQPNATKQMAPDAGSRRPTAAKTIRPSRFKRFLMQRRKFTFGSNGSEKRLHHTNSNGSNDGIQTPTDLNAANGDKNNPFQLTGVNNGAAAMAIELAKQTENNDHAATVLGHCACDARRILKNPKLNWLLSTKPKVETFKRKLMMRRRHSYTGRSGGDGGGNDNNYSLAHCAPFRCIWWSCSDLTDINNANYLRTLYMQYEKCCENRERMRRRCNAAMPTNVPALVKFQSARAARVNGNANNKQKNVNNGRSVAADEFVCKRRASSHRAAKRHSVGSSATGMTDAVKTWVYRRRCLSISFQFIVIIRCYWT